MKQSGSITRAGIVVVVWGAMVGSAGARPAQRPAGAQPPPFEEAVEAARKAGKPLIIEFGAAWCDPCQQLEADLRKPDGQTALQAVHLVRYDVDHEPGTAVKERFRVRSYPTLMAIDGDGKETGRHVGYGDFEAVRAWLVRAGELTVALRDTLGRADATPKDASLQVLAGKRLVAANRPAEARRYLERAVAAADEGLAASATWILADAEVAAQALPIRRRHAERLATRYPTSPEALRALRFLATLPQPPRALVAQVIRERLAGDSRPEELEDLVLYGLRAGAVDAAVQAAERLQPLAGKDPRRLLIVAEAFHMRGDRDRAVPLAEQALAAVTGRARALIARDLQRFRAADGAPGPVLATLTAEGTGSRHSEGPSDMPPWIAAAPKITAEISDHCAPVDESLGEVKVHFLSGGRPEELKVIPERPLPADTVRCLERAALGAEVPANLSFSLSVALDPPWLSQGLAIARQTAGECLPAPIPGEHFEPLQVVLTSAGDHPTVVMPPGQPELAACLQRAFWSVRLPRGMVRGLRILPTRPTLSGTLPLTAENRDGRP
jgi:thioredoxin-like negative regulator of GroEL